MFSALIVLNGKPQSLLWANHTLDSLPSCTVPCTVFKGEAPAARTWIAHSCTDNFTSEDERPNHRTGHGNFNTLPVVVIF
jgi:hypothetical protein